MSVDNHKRSIGVIVSWAFLAAFVILAVWIGLIGPSLDTSPPAPSRPPTGTTQHKPPDD